MSKDKKTTQPKSEILYTKITETMDSKDTITLSTESQTDEGAWDLFMKLKKEVCE